MAFPDHIIETIRHELTTAQNAMDATNPGKARVCCRRAIGAAVAYVYPPADGKMPTALTALDCLITGSQFPAAVQNAARRLRSKVTPGNQAAISHSPLEDTFIILGHLGYDLSGTP